jgi:hypothetical protein
MVNSPVTLIFGQVVGVDQANVAVTATAVLSVRAEITFTIVCEAQWCSSSRHESRDV